VVLHHAQQNSPACFPQFLIKMCQKYFATFVLIYLVFRISFNIKWGNTFLSSVVGEDNKAC